MFNDGVLDNITAGEGELGYPYYQPVSCGCITKVGDCWCRVAWWGQGSWNLEDIIEDVHG